MANSGARGFSMFCDESSPADHVVIIVLHKRIASTFADRVGHIDGPD
jgi:hypothetical protein